MNKININVGRVRAGMAAKGLTIKETAELIGVTRHSLDQILRAGRCQAFMMGRIARVLGIPVYELVAV